MIYLTMLLCFIISILITPVVIKLAFKIGATDKPNQRKVHQKIMPRLGGLAIYISFVFGVWFYQPQSPYIMSIMVGATIIIITGILDDMYEISAKLKLLGQLAAAGVVVAWGGVQVEFINLPFSDGILEFGFLSVPITILWIVGITNAINLIDGLDGLAAGVSSIALITISGMAILFGNPFVVVIASIILASTLGFLVFNFHPAKIFMGDTGALFLGFMISVLSLLGFKTSAFISFIIPIIILGVPISDTFFAILRRIVNKKPLMAPDKSHLHHCLLGLGFTHRQTVLLIYAMASFFGLVAVILSQAKLLGSFALIIALLIIIEVIAEKIGLVGKNYRPLLKFINSVRYSAAKNR
ncbi:glycosyltransferase family 4 protein [Niallia endozanthoxylica]|uniref:Undecaprenyl/decaprenyl-phosphate alpha-N-acetylglucosaminyl 1-phosphate transferase n=1 Tax=Niallia endozanthoxylica TaxID=2036016 RepID=A0A5J5HMJ2_9BACI|nr:MraY family glycosyltransferase [Niallia endozanthoxylica]KAA9022068.1 undecaprenyl/decaprenyl-phosphate alpha-N-acetylglucosaminyl 1-phosphate transferase [Niallia endozanthoxylica]